MRADNAPVKTKVMASLVVVHAGDGAFGVDP